MRAISLPSFSRACESNPSAMPSYAAPDTSSSNEQSAFPFSTSGKQLISPKGLLFDQKAKPYAMVFANSLWISSIWEQQKLEPVSRRALSPWASAASSGSCSKAKGSIIPFIPFLLYADGLAVLWVWQLPALHVNLSRNPKKLFVGLQNGLHHSRQELLHLLHRPPHIPGGFHGLLKVL